MVIVLYHALVSIILRLKAWNNQRRFDINSDFCGALDMLPESVQDAVTKLCELDTLARLEGVVKTAVTLVLPNASAVVVYVLSNDGELISTQSLTHVIPKEGIASQAVQRRRRLQVDSIDPADPLTGLFEGRGCNLKSKLGARLLCCGIRNADISKCNRSVVVCSPVIDKDTEKIVLVHVALCDGLSREEESHLSFLERQICACYKRLHQPTKKVMDRAVNIVVNSKSQADKILELCAELYDRDAATLQLKVVKYLREQTRAETGFLLLVSPESHELFCQVIGNKILEEELRFTLDGSSFSQAIKHNIPLILDDLEENQRNEICSILKCEVRSFLCVPVCSRVNNEVTALACMVNKLAADRFYEQDVQKIQHCFQYTAPVLSSALAVQSERRLRDQTQALLQVARNLFTHLDDLTMLLREIMQEARNLTKAERCSVFLLEEETNELVAKVFDGAVLTDNNQTQSEVRLPANQGIAGHVATTGKMLNIPDAYSHPLFYRGVDNSTGFKTRNILCFPIKDDHGKIVGVAQLCNKINGSMFTTFDEEIAEAFAVYCCISIVHSLMYKKVQDAQNKSRLSNELMIYHMQVTQDEVQRLTDVDIPPPTSVAEEFAKFFYVPRSILDTETPLVCLGMLEEMGFLSKYKIHKETVSRFVLMVKRGYRDPPYHNWSHAFSVAHFCYLLYKNLNLLNYLDEIEVFALFVACLCHDIDHRGTTNSYQVSSQSELAALYSSEGSVMERHHFAQTMCILNTEGCNIFDNLSQEDYEKVLDLMRDIILATDLAHHLRIFSKIQDMVKGGYDRNNTDHHNLLLFLCMTCCDLSDQTKNWNNSKKIAELIYGEFFSQGDLEKALGQCPQEMMDRERACIPELQVGFLDGIALPVYRLLSEMFSEAEEVTSNVTQNRQKWNYINDQMKSGKLCFNQAFDVFKISIDEDDIT